MAESGSWNLGFPLDIHVILDEAQHRWLKPGEIAEILRNHHEFRVSTEAPNKPLSGSVYIFNRKTLRYFRKDGHNWRKKKDGKTIKEAHEKLKVGSVDKLHCYYAHGEDRANFQRRSYWLLETDLMHMVFVHYLEVKGNRTIISPQRNSLSTSENNSLLSSGFYGTSPSSTLSSAAYEEVESEPPVEDNQQASSRFQSYSQSPLAGGSYYAQPSSWDKSDSSPNFASISQACTDRDFGGPNFVSEAQTTVDLVSWQDVLGNSTSGEIAYNKEPGCSMPVQVDWQPSFEDRPSHSVSMNQNPILNLPCDHGGVHPNQETLLEPFYSLPDEQCEERTPGMPLMDAEAGNAMNAKMDNFMTSENASYSFLTNRPLISGLQKGESLKKVDSFSRWVAAELGESDVLDLQSTDGISWGIMGNEYDSSMPASLQADSDTLNPSIPQDQLFSITDYSPNWAFAELKSKVLVIGTFLKSQQELSNCRWSIMFGQVEVAAHILAEGVLSCQAPPHKAGLVSFYVTCSNRLACSEIREFEYRSDSHHIDMGDTDGHGNTAVVMYLYQRIETLLTLGPTASCASSIENEYEKQNIVDTIISLMGENLQEANLISDNDASEPKVVAHLLLEKQLKEKFYTWLLQRVTEDGVGLTIFDEGGQGVLHLAAALGFNWALQPIIISGTRIDFRDVNGWTALHWAAFYGREETVAALVSIGATPGALSHPSMEYPLGRTPADLASSSGHKGISGFLAESSLSTQLSNLGVDGSQDGMTPYSGVKPVSVHVAFPTREGDVPDTLSLKDSLAAVCNATQTAARIHQIFRIQSFQRKQFIEYGGEDNELLNPDENAISQFAFKASRLGRRSAPTNAAAVHIQKQFRGWKKRREYLIMRKKVVKIQAFFRGHQARKKYKAMNWCVGILEKVILRWRRKRSGFRGFGSGALQKDPNTSGTLSQEDDNEVLREGRKQTETRMHKALDRVKSMTQYPEARAQYRRLLTAAKDFRETQEEASSSDLIPSLVDEEAIYPEEDLIDIDSLLDDDTFMSSAFESM